MRSRILWATIFWLIASACFGFPHFYIDAGVGGVFAIRNSETVDDSNAVIYSPTQTTASKFHLHDVSWQNNFNEGFDIDVATGISFNRCWRGEIEFLYQQFRRNIHGSYDWHELEPLTGDSYANSDDNHIEETTSPTRLYILMLNGLYDIDTHSAWLPSVGLGVGFASMNTSGTRTTSLLSVTDNTRSLVVTSPTMENSPSINSTVFAGQFKAQLGRPITSRAAIYVQYRLLACTRFRTSSSSIVINPNAAGSATFNIRGDKVSAWLLDNALEVGVRFYP